MSRETHGPSALRCLTVWSLVTLAASALPVALGRELGLAGEALDHHGHGVPFDSALAAGCAVMLVGCAAWFWALTTLTLALALRGHHGRVPGCPDGVRRLLLVACGLAVLAAAAPATADTSAGSPPSPAPADASARQVLDGLPYPDRPTAGSLPSAAPPGAVASRPVPSSSGPPGTAVMVRAGDTLWDIAARTLPPDAPVGAVDRAWQAIWQANRTVVGPDPDLILPGTPLDLPTTKEP